MCVCVFGVCVCACICCLKVKGSVHRYVFMYSVWMCVICVCCLH